MKISREDVLRVAELAYLELSPDEVELYRGQLDEILSYIGKLQELDVSHVEPMTQTIPGDLAATHLEAPAPVGSQSDRSVQRAEPSRRHHRSVQHRRRSAGPSAGCGQALLPRSESD